MKDGPIERWITPEFEQFLLDCCRTGRIEHDTCDRSSIACLADSEVWNILCANCGYVCGYHGLDHPHRCEEAGMETSFQPAVTQKQDTML